jgi:hypothetical protein
MSGLPIAAEPRKTRPTRPVTRFSRNCSILIPPPPEKAKSDSAMPLRAMMEMASTLRSRTKTTIAHRIGGAEAAISPRTAPTLSLAYL